MAGRPGPFGGGRRFKVEDLLDVHEAARVLHLTEGALYKAAARREIPCVRLSPKRLRFRPSDLSRFIASRAQEPVAPRGGRRVA